MNPYLYRDGRTANYSSGQLLRQLDTDVKRLLQQKRVEEQNNRSNQNELDNADDDEGKSIVGKLDSSLSRGTLASPTSVTLSVWEKIDGTWGDTGLNKTIYDIGFMNRCVSSLASGTLIRCVKMNGSYYYSGDGEDFIGRAALTSSFTRGSTATVTFRGASTTIDDSDNMIPSEFSPISSGTTIQFVKIDGVWKYDGGGECTPPA